MANCILKLMKIAAGPPLLAVASLHGNIANVNDRRPSSVVQPRGAQSAPLLPEHRRVHRWSAELLPGDLVLFQDTFGRKKRLAQQACPPEFGLCAPFGVVLRARCLFLPCRPLYLQGLCRIQRLLALGSQPALV